VIDSSVHAHLIGANRKKTSATWIFHAVETVSKIPVTHDERKNHSSMQLIRWLIPWLFVCKHFPKLYATNASLQPCIPVSRSEASYGYNVDL